MPANVTGASQSTAHLAVCGPRKPARTPPAITSEMALARKAGSEASAAASRKYQKNAACMPCITAETHISGKLCW